MITIWVVLGDGSAACTNMEGGEEQDKRRKGLNLERELFRK